jgi:hypothetical protein
VALPAFSWAVLLVLPNLEMVLFDNSGKFTMVRTMLSTKPSLRECVAELGVRESAVAIFTGAWWGIRAVLLWPLYVVKTVLHAGFSWFGVDLGRVSVPFGMLSSYFQSVSSPNFTPNEQTEASCGARETAGLPGTEKCPEIEGYPELAAVLPKVSTLGGALDWFHFLSKGHNSHAEFEPVLRRLHGADPDSRKVAIREMIESVARVGQWSKFGVFATSLNASKDLSEKYRDIMHEIVEAWFDGVPATWPGRAPFIRMRDKMRELHKSNLSAEEQNRELAEWSQRSSMGPFDEAPFHVEPFAPRALPEQ